MILEEHSTPFPKCERCGSQVPLWRLSNWNYESDKFQIGEEQQRRKETMKHCFEASQETISVNADTLEHATEFPYLCRTVAFNNSYWVALYQNLRKVRRWWGMVAKNLTRMGATVRVRAMIYKAVD